MQVGILIIVLFLVLLLLRVPAAFCMLITTLVYALVEQSVPQSFIPQAMVSGSASYTIMAAPFFILVGELMNSSGITKRLFKFANVLVGHITGGLGHVNVLASVFFSGVSGSAIADAAGLGNVEIKAMVDEGYDPDFSVGITAASSTIGPIIPPSSPMVLYGIMSGTSIGALFMAGIPTGILMAGFMMLVVYIISKKRNYPKSRRATLPEIWKAFKEAFWALLSPLILIVGMLSGFATPTETAAVAAAYSLFLGVVIYKEMTWQSLMDIMRNSIKSIGMVMLLIATGTVFAWMIGTEKVAEKSAELLFSLTSNPYLILLLINLFLLFVGTFVETTSALLVTLPVLLPIVKIIGMSTVQFGVIMVLLLMIGMLTPPMALCLFVTSKIGGISFDRAFKAVLPYYVALLTVLIIINLFPGVTLALTGL
ncbi:TRAP transporter large permease [Enterocloster clostridioformis]|uniref:TRAP transporter large permease n=1 Tax=Enterocloster clostridioformis TaxID=1531 RepID=UPI0002D1815E|nr:TRAP transporter large permease [Enterocloster clostridioformis]ENZ07761.1 TRAP transporter, DctM subunit [[Clostridium] clostridioforme 90B1]